MDTIRSLHALGVVVSMDDVGSGFVALPWLGEVPVDELKLDRSLVERLDQPVGQGRGVAEAVIDVVLRLGLAITAEGVGTEGQAERLAELGCPRAQGWLFGRPLPYSRFSGWIDRMTTADRRPSVDAGASPAPAPPAKRAAPSIASADDRLSSPARISFAIASPSPSSHCSSADRRSLRMQRLRERRDLGAPSSMAVASAAARLAHPVRQPHAQRLVAASTPRPVRIRSIARDWPISRGRRTVPPSIERHAPAPAVHAERRVARGDAQVAPHRQLEPAGHRVALDRGDHRLAELHPRSGPSGRRRRVAPPGCRRPSAMPLRSAPAQNVPPAPVSTATTRDVVGVERAERVGQRRRRSAGRRRCGPRAGRW